TKPKLAKKALLFLAVRSNVLRLHAPCFSTLKC
ncbi:ABC transporter family protein, partial [Vibrio parahaemolyticus V-223/04]